jgi:hypothetical protein
MEGSRTDPALVLRWSSLGRRRSQVYGYLGEHVCRLQGF